MTGSAKENWYTFGVVILFIISLMTLLFADGFDKFWFFVPLVLAIIAIKYKPNF